MKPRVCLCGRVLIGDVWIRCPDVVRQLQAQEVEMVIEACNWCSEDAQLGAEASVTIEVAHATQIR